MVTALVSSPAKRKTIKSMDEKLMKFWKLNETYVFVWFCHPFNFLMRRLDKRNEHFHQCKFTYIRVLRLAVFTCACTKRYTDIVIHMCIYYELILSWPLVDCDVWRATNDERRAINPCSLKTMMLSTCILLNVAVAVTVVSSVSFFAMFFLFLFYLISIEFDVDGIVHD